MAVIQRKTDGRRIHIPHQLVIGRAASCDLMLAVSSVSTHHAVIRWDGSKWLIADLGSRNGTHVNGQRLAPRSATLYRLSRGDELTFAEREEAWVFVDDGPPQSVLIPADPLRAPVPLLEGRLLAWPDEERAEAYVYFERGAWHAEDTDGSVQHLRSGQAFDLGGHRFTFHSPGPVPETPQATSPVARRELHDAVLTIRVASDEETAALEVSVSGEKLTLSRRTHLYLLAYLARERQRSTSTGGKAEDWICVEQACRDLRVEPAALAVLVHRCRKDFESLRFSGASRVIERTRGLLRIGILPNRVEVALHGTEPRS